MSIPERADISEFHNSRRLAVNKRLMQVCRANGVEFASISDVRNHLSSDRLHLNKKGQDVVARDIFNHCKICLN